MKVKISNPDLSTEERSHLTADYSSGTTLTVRNSDGFTTNWFAVIGEPGQEQTETKRITATSTATTITIASALSFAHSKSTPVYLCQWNQWAFYRKPTGSTYSADTNSPFDIEWDDKDKTTTIVVTGGVTTDTYKWRPYNSTSGNYGTYSDELAGTGLTRKSVGYIIEQIQKTPTAQEVDQETILGFINDFQDLVYEEMPKAWWFSKEGTAVSTAVDTYKYAITENWSDFLSMNFMRYQYILSTTSDRTYNLTFAPLSRFYEFKSDANQSSDDNAKYWTLLPPDDDSAKGYIGLHPTPETDDCYLRPAYFFELTDLDSFGDTIVVPKPKAYMDYCLYRIFDEIKEDTTNAKKYSARVERNIISLKRRSRRQLGQPELFRFRGQRGWSKTFGSGGIISSSESRELYW